MPNNILEISIITMILIFLIEYVRFFNETKLPLFFNYSFFPLTIYIISELIIGIFCVLIISFNTNYEYPHNIIYISLISSLIPTGFISNIELYASNNELNIFRKHLSESRINIVSDIKKNETVEIRKTGCELEKCLTLGELKNVLRQLDEKQCLELEERYKGDEEAQRSMFASEIANKDLKFSKSLLK